MKNLPKIDVIAILSYVVGLGLIASSAGFPQAVDTIATTFGAAPGVGQKAAAFIGALATLAGLLLRLLHNPTNAPATAVVQGAPIVPAGTVSVNANTPVIATNSETKGSPS